MPESDTRLGGTALVGRKVIVEKMLASKESHTTAGHQEKLIRPLDMADD